MQIISRRLTDAKVWEIIRLKPFIKADNIPNTPNTIYK